MAEYIDRKQINLFGFFDAGDYSQAMRCINNMPPADVVEREKIDKAIKEMEEVSNIFTYKTNKTLGASYGFRKAIDILKKNIGE